MIKAQLLFAQTYSCDTYGQAAYNQCAATSSGLANTGYDVLIPVCFAAALVGASVIYFIKRAVHRRQARRASVSEAQ